MSKLIGDSSGLIAYDALAQAIVARHLQTELVDAECVDWFERPTSAARRLADLNFDQAPATRNGRLVGTSPGGSSLMRREGRWHRTSIHSARTP